jgi:UDP-2,4-diacetamido-2,4,6-trideoxy-beta-L-altropyranose hydrolase
MTMAGPAVTVLAEAGRGVGLGHLRRCQALAAALTDSGAAVELLVAGEGWEAAAATRLDWLGDAGALRATLRARPPDALVVDSYRADAALLRDLGTQAPCVVAVDDLADRALPVSIVVNGGWHAPRLAYRTLPETVRLLGSQYALLDPAYATPARRAPGSGIRRVLVTLGGDADSVALATAVAAVKHAAPTAGIDVAVGAWIAADVTAAGVTVHRGPASLRELIIGADLVVSGGGMTLYECLAAGAPVVAVVMADNQRPNVVEMARGGLIVDGGPSLEAAVAQVASDHGLRRKLATLGREAVDGRGATRVAVAIMRACRAVGLAEGAR